MAVRTHDKPLRAEGDGDVNKCVNNLIEAFANGLDIFKRLRERRRKHKARKESQAPEPINSAELQLSNSLRRGPQDLAERYDECYSQAGMGRRFATGDSIAHASLAEILMRLNTGLVSIITAFLNHEQKGTSGHMKMNYRSLTDLSEASRRDALTSMSQLYQRLSQSQLQIHPALRINAIESSGNSSDSSKDNRKSTGPRGRRPSGSHVTRLATKSSSQPQLCMVRSKSRNTSRKDSTSSSSSSKLASKSTSRSESPYGSPLQSPVPEYAVLDPLMEHRVDMKSPIYTRRISAGAQISPFSPDRKRIDSLDAVAQPQDYFSLTPAPQPRAPAFASTARKPLPSSSPTRKEKEKENIKDKEKEKDKGKEREKEKAPSSPKKSAPPVPSKPVALSNNNPASNPSGTPMPFTAHMKRRLDKATPSQYTFASDSTKLGEIPETRWAQPFDYERAELLNNFAAAAAKVRVPTPAQVAQAEGKAKEKEKKEERPGKGWKLWKRSETA